MEKEAQLRPWSLRLAKTREINARDQGDGALCTSPVLRRRLLSVYCRQRHQETISGVAYNIYHSDERLLSSDHVDFHHCLDPMIEAIGPLEEVELKSGAQVVGKTWR